MGECCKMFSGVLGKIKNFVWGLLNQTGRASALPGGLARDAIRRRHPGTWLARPDRVARVLQWRLAARGEWPGAPRVSAPRVGSAAQAAVVPPIANRDGQGGECNCPDDDGNHAVLLSCQPSGARHVQIIVEQPERVNSFVASFCAVIQAASWRLSGDCLATVRCARADGYIHLTCNVSAALLNRYILFQMQYICFPALWEMGLLTRPLV